MAMIGFSSLHDAALNNRKLLLCRLISEGHDVNAVDYRGETPLHFACLKGYASSAAALIKAGSRVNQETISFETPLYFACDFGHLNCCEILLKNGATDYGLRSCLSVAVKSQNLDCAEALLNYGVTNVNHDGVSEQPLYHAWEKDDLQAAKLLLLAGARMTYTQKNFTSTYLHMCSKLNRSNFLRLLLKFGGNPLLEDSENQTARDVTSVGTESHNLLLFVEKNPRSLLELCRHQIFCRILASRKRLSTAVKELNLPRYIHSYLMFEMD